MITRSQDLVVIFSSNDSRSISILYMLKRLPIKSKTLVCYKAL